MGLKVLQPHLHLQLRSCKPFADVGPTAVPTAAAALLGICSSGSKFVIALVCLPDLCSRETWPGGKATTFVLQLSHLQQTHHSAQMCAAVAFLSDESVSPLPLTPCFLGEALLLIVRFSLPGYKVTDRVSLLHKTPQSALCSFSFSYFLLKKKPLPRKSFIRVPGGR